MITAARQNSKGFCCRFTGLHIYGFIALELLDGEIVWRCAVENDQNHHVTAVVCFSFFHLCRTNRLEIKIPFSEEKILKGIGQLWPHGAEPAGGGVLPGHG